MKELSPLEKVTLPTAALPGRMESLGRSMKRAPRRILGQFGGENAGGQAYHVMSRTAGGEMVFGDTERIQNACPVKTTLALPASLSCFSHAPILVEAPQHDRATAHCSEKSVIELQTDG